MKNIHQNLTEQLILLAGIVCGIIFISVGILIPRTLLPIYEKSIYQYLKQPLEFIRYDLNNSENNSDVAYLYITQENEIIVSGNLSKIINMEPVQILLNIKNEYGKFRHFGKVFYYSKDDSKFVTKIALTNDNYIVSMKKDILYKMIPVLVVTFLLVAALFIMWARRLVKKIEYLKLKVDNLDNDDFIDEYKSPIDDELNVLSEAIDNIKITLKEQEEYKNQMYQNISHDFKTPLTVIKSYMEAIDDGVETVENGNIIITDQLNKLELKVHSLLYLNKLSYIKDNKNYQESSVNVATVLSSSIEKFKIIKPNINFEVFIQNEKTSFRGTNDMWEAIIDNMLSNFIRYANKNIKVTFKNNRLIFYNDGPNIDPEVLSDIFTPYTKGIKGQFGLGLSIIKKTLSVCGYEISVQNEKKGVSFIIK